MTIHLPMWLVWTAGIAIAIPVAVWLVFFLDAYNLAHPSKRARREVEEHLAELRAKGAAEWNKELEDRRRAIAERARP
jgi:phosphotransferase system  glucose/maltose/N-acetylglucosamine-specific IIC component